MVRTSLLFSILYKTLAPTNIDKLNKKEPIIKLKIYPSSSSTIHLSYSYCIHLLPFSSLKVLPILGIWLKHADYGMYVDHFKALFIIYKNKRHQLDAFSIH